MRNAILVLSIIGVVFTFAIGACTGICLDSFSELADESSDEGGKLFLWAILEAIIGLVGGIMSFRKFGEGRVGGIILLVAATLSIHNTMQFFTSGVLFAIAGILAIVSGGSKSETTGGSESETTGGGKTE